MELSKLDLTDPAVVCREIFDEDKWVKDEFAKYLSAEILKLSEVLAGAFKYFPKLDELSADGDEQAAFAASFVFCVFDDLVVSAKLLVSGKMVASGNLMRQAIEGVCVAILCASRQPLFVTKGKKQVSVDYWRKVKTRDPIAYAHKAVNQLEMNCGLLSVSRTALDRLKKARSKYHFFSHPSQLGMATRICMGEPGSIYIGGQFDETKLPVYRTEIEERTGLCSILPELILGLVQVLEKGRN
ncbi:MAG: hypothetical protein WAV95_00745 [Azonexus sp.]